MQATITVLNQRFYFKFMYDHNIVSWFRRVDNSIWHRDSKQWSFPIEILSKFIGEFGEKFPTIRLIIKKTPVILRNNRGVLIMVMTCLVENWNLFRAIEGYGYDRESKMLTFPIAQLEDVKAALEQNGVLFEYEDSEEIQ